jgi:hypothetical protein
MAVRKAARGEQGLGACQGRRTRGSLCPAGRGGELPINAQPAHCRAGSYPRSSVTRLMPTTALGLLAPWPRGGPLAGSWAAAPRPLHALPGPARPGPWPSMAIVATGCPHAGQPEERGHPSKRPLGEPRTCQGPRDAGSLCEVRCRGEPGLGQHWSGSSAAIASLMQRRAARTMGTRCARTRRWGRSG